jgi:hypothetical protein
MDLMNKSRLAEVGAATQKASMELRQPNLTGQLEMRLEYHRAEAAKLEEAIAAVKKNPEIEHLLNLLQRL